MSTIVTVRLDSEVKKQAEVLFEELGMSFSTAVNVFIRQCLREGRLPFQPSLNQPNAETVAAMLEAERLASDHSVKRYSLSEALAELKK